MTAAKIRTKQHILAEIKRTAAENGGKALGEKAFFSETGIRQADWLGRHWARWSDALAEAGFGPNQWQGAYTDEQVLAPLAEYVRELGRFPVKAELELKRRSDPTFPSKTVYQRYGRKHVLAGKLRDFANARGYDDVAALCGPVADVEADEEAYDAPASAEQHGFVYLIRSGRFHKIGRTNAVGRRERELAIQLPERTRLVHSIKTDDPAGIEDYWHRRFADRRKNGEWFELTAQDVAAFRRRKFM